MEVRIRRGGSPSDMQAQRARPVPTLKRQGQAKPAKPARLAQSVGASSPPACSRSWRICAEACGSTRPGRDRRATARHEKPSLDLGAHPNSGWISWWRPSSSSEGSTPARAAPRPPTVEGLGRAPAQRRRAPGPAGVLSLAVEVVASAKGMRAGLTISSTLWALKEKHSEPWPTAVRACRVGGMGGPNRGAATAQGSRARRSAAVGGDARQIDTTSGAFAANSWKASSG